MESYPIFDGIIDILTNVTLIPYYGALFSDSFVVAKMVMNLSI
jgi:hypothetical protein